MLIQGTQVSAVPYQTRLTSPIRESEQPRPQDTLVISSQEPTQFLRPRCDCQQKAEPHGAAKLIGAFGLALSTLTIPLTALSCLCVGAGLLSNFTVPYTIMASGVGCGLVSAVAQGYLESKGDPLF